MRTMLKCISKMFGFAVKEMQEKCWIDENDEMAGVKMSSENSVLQSVNGRKSSKSWRKIGIYNRKE